MPKYLPVFDNTQKIEEEKKEQTSFDPNAIKAAGVGALNQWNLLSNVLGGIQTLTGSKPIESNLTDKEWEDLSLKERYKQNTAPIEKEVQRLEDEYPKASLAGNAGGAAALALLTGGGSLLGNAGQVALKGAAKVTPKVASNLAKTVSKVNPTVLDIGTKVADSSLYAGIDSAMFERDPNKKGEAFVKGSLFGAAVPLVLGGGKKLLTSGKTTEKYIERIPEVVEMRKTGKKPVTDLQERVVEKIEEVEPKLKVESGKVAKKVKESTNSSNLDVQRKGNELLDKMTEAKINFDNGISEASTGGYELLESIKDLSTKEITDVIDDAIKKTDMLSDPHAKLLTKYKNRLQLNNGKVEGIELKNIVNAMYADYNDYVSKLARGAKVPKTYKRIKRAAETANALLKKASPAYEEYMKPLAYQTEKSKNIQKTLFEGKKSKETIDQLKNYKKDLTTQQALDDFKEQTGIDLRPAIDDLIDYESTVKSLDDIKEDKLVKAITSSSNSSEYQSFLNAAERYKQKTGIDLMPEISQLRQDYLVDLLDRAKTLTTPKGESGITPFQKNVKNLNVQDYQPTNPIQRIMGDDVPSDIKVTQAKSNKARKDIEDLSNFLGDNVGKNTKDIEAASLYDYYGTGKANGSRMVNLMGSIGAAAGNAIKKVPIVGASLGGLIGSMSDTGKLQRARRELLDYLYNPANQNKIEKTGNILRYEGMFLPKEFQKEENREASYLQSFEDYMKANRMGELVKEKKAQNKEVWGRA